MTDATHLLFAATGIFLGDVRTQAGTLGHVALTADGEQAIGGRFRSWHEQGITVGDKQVLPSDTGFEVAFKAWCAVEQLTIVPLPSPAHDACWNLLVHLPLPAADRLGVAQAIANASADTLIAWQQYLHEAATLVVAHSKKAEAAIRKLQQKAVAPS